MNTQVMDARDINTPTRELPIIDLGPYLQGVPGALEKLKHQVAICLREFRFSLCD
jgi:hypothetical protein